jgi:L,D-transpeptidase catalytic domain
MLGTLVAAIGLVAALGIAAYALEPGGDGPAAADADSADGDRAGLSASPTTQVETVRSADATRRPFAAPLDARCETGRVICVDKTARTLRWVVDGRVLMTFDARFGGPKTPTREGRFRVYDMLRFHESSLYGTQMPFAMFFSGGQAVHYSKEFKVDGYDGASHGCVNLRDRRGVAELFDRVREGDKVVVYRS